MRVCTRPDCERAHHAQGFCGRHYMAARKSGEIALANRPRPSYRVAPTGCWIWTGRIDVRGYGRWSGRLAYRVLYELIVGPIPEGLELDHLCCVTQCVNPAHLEPVTRDENMRRRAALITHCLRGHEFTPENTYIRPDGTRDCRACIRRRAREYKARRAAA